MVQWRSSKPNEKVDQLLKDLDAQPDWESKATLLLQSLGIVAQSEETVAEQIERLRKKVR